MKTRTPARKEFLTDLLITAIENYGYGWFAIEDYQPDDGTAVITGIDRDGTPNRFEIDLDTFATGLRVIRQAQLAIVSGEEVRVNASTNQRLFFGGEPRKELLLADRTNGGEGDYDVVGALAVLECGLFGQVVYG